MRINERARIKLSEEAISMSLRGVLLLRHASRKSKTGCRAEWGAGAWRRRPTCDSGRPVCSRISGVLPVAEKVIGAEHFHPLPRIAGRVARVPCPHPVAPDLQSQITVCPAARSPACCSGRRARMTLGGVVTTGISDQLRRFDPLGVKLRQAIDRFAKERSMRRGQFVPGRIGVGRR